MHVLLAWEYDASGPAQGQPRLGPLKRRRETMAGLKTGHHLWTFNILAPKLRDIISLFSKFIILQLESLVYNASL